MEERSVEAGVRLGYDDRVLGRGDVEDRPCDVCVALGVPGHGRVRARFGRLLVEQRYLEEGRRLVAPMRAAVKGPGVAAVVEADAGVVLADEDVGRVERVDGDVLACLGAE